MNNNCNFYWNQLSNNVKNDNFKNYKAIEKETFDNYTVKEVIDILSKFPQEYEFLCCGESDYAIWVDHDSKMVSIDRETFINGMIENIEKFNICNMEKENE